MVPIVFIFFMNHQMNYIGPIISITMDQINLSAIEQAALGKLLEKFPVIFCNSCQI